ncbi:MAG: alpha/beta hydrolase [Candidatus Saccharimonadales bacterium]
MKHPVISTNLTPTMRQLPIFGSNVHIWTYGKKSLPTIVVIHGYRGTHHGLERIIEHLPGYQFIVPDLPGFGESSPMTERPHTIDGYADAIAKMITQLKLEPTILLGHSMGSIIAGRLTATQPQLISKLILINPIAKNPMSGLSGLIISPSILYHWIGGVVLPEKAGRRIFDGHLPLLLGSVVMTKTKDPSERQLIHATHKEYMTHYSDTRTLREAYKASISRTVVDDAANIPHDTLLIAGSEDSIAPIKSQYHLKATLPRATLHEIGNVGHLVHYETASEAARTINDFLT